MPKECAVGKAAERRCRMHVCGLRWCQGWDGASSSAHAGIVYDLLDHHPLIFPSLFCFQGDGELVLEVTDPSHPLPAAASDAESPPEPSPASSGSGSWAKAEADEVPAAANAETAKASSSTSSSTPAAMRGAGGSSGGAATPSGQASQAGGSNTGSGSAAAAQALSAAGTAPAAAEEAGAEAGVEQQLQRLRLAAEHSGDFMQQLAAKYGCSEGGKGSHTDAG